MQKIERILMATELGYMPARVGGAQISLHEMNLELMARGIEVAVLCGAQRAQPADKVPFDNYEGYRVYRAQRPEIAAAAVCRDFKPDAVVVQGGAMTPLVSATIAAGVPTAALFVDCEFQNGNLFAPNDQCLFLGNSPFTRRRAEVLLGITCHLSPSAIRVGDYVTEAGEGGRSHVLFVGSSPPEGHRDRLCPRRAAPGYPVPVRRILADRGRGPRSLSGARRPGRQYRMVTTGRRYAALLRPRAHRPGAERLGRFGAPRRRRGPGLRHPGPRQRHGRPA